MESLQDLLGRYDPEEPPEVSAIKRFIADHFKAESSIRLQGEVIIITVNSASLAGSLRMRLPDIQAAAKTKRRLIFRIG